MGLKFTLIFKNKYNILLVIIINTFFFTNIILILLKQITYQFLFILVLFILQEDNGSPLI